MRPWVVTALVIFLLSTLGYSYEGTWGSLPFPHTDLGEPGAAVSHSVIRAGFYVSLSGNGEFCGTGSAGNCLPSQNQVLMADLTVFIPVKCAIDSSEHTIELFQEDIFIELPNLIRPVPSNNPADDETYLFEQQIPVNICSSGDVLLDYANRPMRYRISFISNNNANQRFIFHVHAGRDAAPWSLPSDPLSPDSYFPPISAALNQVAFCRSKLDLRTGDSFILRDFVRNATDANSAINWSVIKFTYNLASADDSTDPPDWNLGLLNSGGSITITPHDVESGGNQGAVTGFRVYVYRVGYPRYFDKITIYLFSPSAVTPSAAAGDFDNCSVSSPSPSSPSPPSPPSHPPATTPDGTGPSPPPSSSTPTSSSSPTPSIPINNNSSTPSTTTSSSSPTPSPTTTPPSSVCPTNQTHTSDPSCASECLCSSWELIQSSPSSAEGSSTFLWRVCNTCSFDVSWQAICLDGLTYAPSADPFVSNSMYYSNRCAYQVTQVNGQNEFPPCSGLKYTPMGKCFPGAGAESSSSGQVSPSTAQQQQQLVQFCTFALDLTVGDELNLRELVRYVRTPSDPVDFSRYAFTYSMAGANDAVNGSWNLDAFNSGAVVTIADADTRTVGNRGFGQFRLYIYQQESPTNFIDDTILIRLHNSSSSISSSLAAAKASCESAAQEKVCDFIRLTVVTPAPSYEWRFFQHAGQGQFIDENRISSLSDCCASKVCPASSTTPNRICERVGFAPPDCTRCLNLSVMQLNAWCVPDGNAPPSYNWVLLNSSVSPPLDSVRPLERDSLQYQLDCDCSRIEIECTEQCSGATCVCDKRTGSCVANAVCSATPIPTPSGSTLCPDCPASSQDGQQCSGRGACVCGQCACATINGVTYSGAACEFNSSSTAECYAETSCSDCVATGEGCEWCHFAAGSRCQRAGTCVNSGVIGLAGCSIGCPRNCSGHGRCTEDVQLKRLRCECAAGWSGFDCSVRQGRGLSPAKRAAIIASSVAAGAIAVAGIAIAGAVWGAKGLASLKVLLGFNPIEGGGPAVRENVIYREK